MNVPIEDPEVSDSPIHLTNIYYARNRDILSWRMMKKGEAGSLAVNCSIALCPEYSFQPPILLLEPPRAQFTSLGDV